MNMTLRWFSLSKSKNCTPNLSAAWRCHAQAGSFSSALLAKSGDFGSIPQVQSMAKHVVSRDFVKKKLHPRQALF